VERDLATSRFMIRRNCSGESSIFLISYGGDDPDQATFAIEKKRNCGKIATARIGIEPAIDWNRSPYRISHAHLVRAPDAVRVQYNTG